MIGLDRFTAMRGLEEEYLSPIYVSRSYASHAHIEPI